MSEEHALQLPLAQPEVDALANIAPSSSWKRLNKHSKLFPHCFPPHKKSKLEESDEDLFTVPDVEDPPPPSSGANVVVSSDHNYKDNNASVSDIQQHLPVKRRRGRNPADKECRRLKRLLRNRVSAQQARERKKVYVNELELRARDLQDRISKLEESISTLIKENTMLRKILMNTKPKVDESSESQQDHLSKS